MKVEITEFVRPRGSQVKRVVEVDDSLKDRIDAVTRDNSRITLEHLGIGTSSVCIESGDEDVLMEIVDSSKWETAIPKILGDYTPEFVKEFKKRQDEGDALREI